MSLFSVLFIHFDFFYKQYSPTIEMIYDYQNRSFNSSNNHILATVIQLFDINEKEQLLL